MWFTIAIVGLVSLLIGGIIIFLWKRGENATITARNEQQAQELTELKTKQQQSDATILGLTNEKIRFSEQANRLPVLQDEINKLRDENATLKADLAAKEAAQIEKQVNIDERIEALTSLRGEIESRIKNIAGEALEANQKSFITIANEVLDKQQKAVSADLDQKRIAVEDLLKPVSTTLAQYQLSLKGLEESRQEAYGQVTNELKSLSQAQSKVQTAANDLTNALKSSSSVKGVWGEETLKNVLDTAGLSKYCDFDTQVTDSEGKRPDCLIHIPGGSIIVDAKASATAYFEAMDATDAKVKESLLKKHAETLRARVKELSKKGYQANITNSPELVVLFLPIDNLFSAACEQDPKLYTDALSSGVVITTPVTLIALAKAISVVWKQKKTAENAQQVAVLGKELYKRLAKFGTNVSTLGKNLGTTVKTYDSFVASLEGSVMPQARKFQDLEVEGTDTALAELTKIEHTPRQLQADKDLEIEEGNIPKLPQ